MKWEPISELDLINEIQKTKLNLNGELWNFWQLIKIEPTKWKELTFGKKGNGFWVVALCGKKVIWYNDIEEGFNISNYSNIGTIDEYFCNQEKVNDSVTRLFDLVKLGGKIIGQDGPPR